MSRYAKDRSKPFSRKHLRYWMTAAGGMVIIMVINVALGFWLYKGEKPTTRKPQYHEIPPMPAWAIDAGVGSDAGVDAQPPLR